MPWDATYTPRPSPGRVRVPIGVDVYVRDLREVSQVGSWSQLTMNGIGITQNGEPVMVWTPSGA